MEGHMNLKALIKDLRLKMESNKGCKIIIRVIFLASKPLVLSLLSPI